MIVEGRGSGLGGFFLTGVGDAKWLKPVWLGKYKSHIGQWLSQIFNVLTSQLFARSC